MSAARPMPATMGVSSVRITRAHMLVRQVSRTATGFGRPKAGTASSTQESSVAVKNSQRYATESDAGATLRKSARMKLSARPRMPMHTNVRTMAPHETASGSEQCGAGASASPRLGRAPRAALCRAAWKRAALKRGRTAHSVTPTGAGRYCATTNRAAPRTNDDVRQTMVCEVLRSSERSHAHASRSSAVPQPASAEAMEHHGWVNSSRSTMARTTVAAHSSAPAGSARRRIWRMRQGPDPALRRAFFEHSPTETAQAKSAATMPQQARAYVLLRCVMSLRVE